MKMKIRNNYGMQYAGPKRRQNGPWKRRTGMALWVLVAVLLVLGYCTAQGAQNAQAEETALVICGMADWVAFGVLVTLVLAMLGVWAWQCIVTVGEPSRDEEPMDTPPLDDPKWMRELMAYFQRRGVLLSRAHCWALRVRAEGRGAPGMVKDERLPLLLLDAWVREHLKLRLFVSTLQEVQAICLGKGVAA